MFDSIIDSLHNRYAPLAQRCAGTVGNYADHCISLLRDIRDNTDNPQFQEARYPIFAQLNAGNARTRTIDVPQFQDWELDYIAVVPTAASIVTIRQGGFLVFANNYANPQTTTDVGAVVRGGTQLQVVATVDTEVTLIFTAQVPKEPTGRADGRSVGEEQFTGMQGTEGGAEPDRHFAVGLDMIEDGTRDIIGSNNNR
jgi:hypothetical protein